MDESVALLLLQYLFPEWMICRDEHGNWRAVRSIVVSSGDFDGLLERLAATDPDAARRAASLLEESGRRGPGPVP